MTALIILGVIFGLIVIAWHVKAIIYILTDYDTDKRLDDVTH